MTSHERAEASNSVEDRFSVRYQAVHRSSVQFRHDGGHSVMPHRSLSVNFEKPLSQKSKVNCRLLAIILAIMIIPMQILLRKTLRAMENRFIIDF